MTDPDGQRPQLTFRTRLTIALVIAAIVPLVVTALVALVLDAALGGQAGGRPGVWLFAALVVGALAIPFAFLSAPELLSPLRALARSVDRVSTGEPAVSLPATGDDELGRLVDSHNRLASDLVRRSQQVAAILDAVGSLSPGDGTEKLLQRARRDARVIFSLIDASVSLGRPASVLEDEVVPGEPRQLSAVLRLGDEDLGMLFGRLPATRVWGRSDQDLYELFASHVAVALRNAELLARVESQNARLLELDAAKDDFLRGVSHNLQSPLTSIRAHADELARERPDGRLEIIGEQADRLSRMVRQLLTVSRLESGAIRPRSEVINLAARARRAWEALGAGDVEFELRDASDGWLAVADPDQLDQVLWAVLDNAVTYGERRPVEIDIGPKPSTSQLRLTVADGGAGISEYDRQRLFTRFARGAEPSDGGSGLGLYVSRELCRAMGGDLVLEAAAGGVGAAFSVYLPAEPVRDNS